jgi:hypothetical protein
MQQDNNGCAGCARWTAIGTIGGHACGRCGAARSSFHEDGQLLSYCTPASFRCGGWRARAEEEVMAA